MADLPDYYTQAQISEAQAASLKGGLDANKSPIPVSKDIYLATDTVKLYYCVVDGAWTDITHACLLLAGGTMSGNIAMGANKLTGLGAPAAQDDSLRYGRAEIRNNEIAAAAAIAYSKLNLTGLVRNADIKADAAIALSKMATNLFLPTIMTTRGDIVYRGASDPTRLAKGTDGQFLKIGANDPVWADVAVAGEGHISIEPSAYNAIIQGAWVLTVDTASLKNGVIRNTSDTDRDRVNYKVYLDEGTYTLRCLMWTQSEGSIIKVYEEGNLIATFDAYSAGTVKNVVFSQTGIAIAAAGLKTLLFDLDGKHASSTGYLMALQSISLWRTA